MADVVRCLELGAAGYLAKDATRGEMPIAEPAPEEIVDRPHSGLLRQLLRRAEPR